MKRFEHTNANTHTHTYYSICNKSVASTYCHHRTTSQVDAFLQPRQGFLHYNDKDANQLKFYVCTFTTNFTPSLLPSIFTLQCIRMFLNVHYIYYCSCIPPFSHLYDDCGALNAFNMLNIYGFYRYELRQYIKIAFK